MDRPDLGHGVAGVLSVIAQHMTERVGMDVYFEPMPAEGRAIHFCLIPRTFDVQREERRRMGLHDLYTAMLTLDVLVAGRGTGREFMAEAMHGAFLAARLFDGPITVHLGAEIYATMCCVRKDSGAFLQSLEEGAQDYEYVEKWEGNLLFPYVFDTDQPGPVIVPPDMWPVTVTESPA